MRGPHTGSTIFMCIDRKDCRIAECGVAEQIAPGQLLQDLVEQLFPGFREWSALI